MLALRRIATASPKTYRWEKLIRAEARCISQSSCVFKKFPTENQKKIVYLPKGQDNILISELAERMKIGVRTGIIGHILRDAGVSVNVRNSTEVVPLDIAELVVLECDMVPVYEEAPVTRIIRRSVKALDVRNRPPVVTIMGHIDHGKTTLLDYLRKSSIADKEAGGITQHIGAFSVALPDGKKVTFIDTPGHGAFNSMRARGAYVTDIVVLVVAADDGVKTQTLESIKHIHDAGVPVIVALNKVDKTNIKLDVTKTQLLGFGLHLEEFGGDVQCVEISALKGTNIPKLIETILVEAELADLKAEFKGPIEGIVIESKMDAKHGCVASILVGKGTLKSGAVLVSGNVWGKAKKLLNEMDNEIANATPSTPVKVTGWKQVPNAGDAVYEVNSETDAKTIIEDKLKNVGKLSSELHDVKPLSSRNVEIVQSMKTKKEDGEPLEEKPQMFYNTENKLDLVIKGDVTGSVEAILQALKTYKSNKINMSVLHAGVGTVTESDITTAAAFQGTILAFNVRISKNIQDLAKEHNVPIKKYKVIYKLLEELKKSLTAKLPLVRVDTEKGRGQIIQVFKLTGTRKAVVAGCSVKNGVLNKNDSYKVMRYNKVIHEGNLLSMKRGVEEASSVPEGNECGVSFEKFNDFDQGDFIVGFTSKQVKQEIDWEFGF